MQRALALHRLVRLRLRVRVGVRVRVRVRVRACRSLRSMTRMRAGSSTRAVKSGR